MTTFLFVFLSLLPAYPVQANRCSNAWRNLVKHLTPSDHAPNRTYATVVANLKFQGALGDAKTALEYLMQNPNELSTADKIRLWQEMSEGINRGRRGFESNSFTMTGKYEGTAFIGGSPKRRSFLFILNDGRVYVSTGTDEAVDLKEYLRSTQHFHPQFWTAPLDRSKDPEAAKKLNDILDGFVKQQIESPGK